MRKGEERRMLNELVDIMQQLSDWEMQFVESLSDQLDNTDSLTERQRAKLVELYEQRVLGY